MSRPQIVAWSGLLFRRQLNKVLDYLESSMGVSSAENVVLKTYGDVVSVKEKGKDLNKFGLNDAVGSNWATVAQFQGSEINETYLTTNGINAVVSSSASDTQNITIEGHTIDGSGNLTFATQTLTLTGQTPVALTTPLARATRAFIANSGVFGTTPAPAVGTISVYDDTDGATSGVPDTDSAVKLILDAGFSQSEKASTTISANDYWFITNFSASVADGTKSANYVFFRMAIRDVPNGGAWRPLGQDIVLRIGGDSPPPVIFDPYRIVPKNHDWVIAARADGGVASVYAEAQGYLAAIQ